MVISMFQFIYGQAEEFPPGHFNATKKYAAPVAIIPE
jgi:hypothetical protein